MIHRTKKQSGNFVQFDKQILTDDSISLKSKMALIYMLGFPDDWKFNKTKIRKDLKIGEKALDTILAELRNNGYLTMIKQQTPQGWNWEYIIYEEKLEIPIPLKPTHGKPTDGEPTHGESRHGNIPPLNYNNLTNNNITNNNLTDNNINYKDIYNYQFPSSTGRSKTFGLVDVSNYYFQLYSVKMNKSHPNLKNIVDLLAVIKGYSETEELTFEDWQVMIYYYMYHSNFAKKIDYNMNHFLSDGILFNLINDLENIHEILDITVDGELDNIMS